MRKSFKRLFSVGCVVLIVFFARPSLAQNANQIADAHFHTALDDYIARPEPDFKWSIGKQTADATILEMDSQRWQGKVWHHQLIVMQPAQNKYPDTALLFINVGDMTGMIPLMKQAANLTGATVVALNGIPDQPRWGRAEDGLIAYTFQQWFQTGDNTWPLLLPMTKSAVKAMDAVQEFSAQKLAHPITKFVAFGGSKRGWTTWLAAAEDRRVIGIIPIVYNMLNLSRQLPHQKEVFGDYSQMINDFVEVNLPQMLATPHGKVLSDMVDPWAYRERITVPKLIINSTNDPYFALDAEKYYRDDLRGPSDFYDAPNAGHGTGMPVQTVLGTIVGWFHWLKSGADFPVLHLAQGKDALTFRLNTSAPSTGARLWVAHATTRDFRPAKWNSVEMSREGDHWLAKIAPAPADAKYTAVIGEADYAVPGTFLPMKLSSQVEIRVAVK